MYLFYFLQKYNFFKFKTQNENVIVRFVVIFMKLLIVNVII